MSSEMPPETQPAVTAVVTTAPDSSVAESLATRIVEERLAACANVVPGVTSIFRWEGEVQRETEVLVVFKTTRAGFADLRDRIVALHPYDVPEVLAFPVSSGSDDYLRWVVREVEGA